MQFSLDIAFSLCSVLDRPRLLLLLLLMLQVSVLRLMLGRKCQQHLACEHRAAFDTGHHPGSSLG